MEKWKEHNMKMIKVVTVAVATIAAAGSAMADSQTAPAGTGHIWPDPKGWWYGHCPTAEGERFRADELSFDVFGSFLAQQDGFPDMFDTSLRRDGNSWGGGVGLNYFPD